MIHSSHRDRKTKAIAEAVAMIADAYPELDPRRPRLVRETDAMVVGERHRILRCAGPLCRAHYGNKESTRASRPTPTRAARNSPKSKTGLDLRPGPAAPPISAFTLPSHALTPAAPAAKIGLNIAYLSRLGFLPGL